mgnify:CR=1 FL=1
MLVSQIKEEDLTLEINLSKDTPINFLVERNGEKKEIVITPKLVEEDENKTYMIGFSFEKVNNPGIIDSFKQGFKETLSAISQTYKSLKLMVTGKVNFKTDVGGPVSIIRISSEAAKNGIWNLMNFVAFLSINLAVFNMLPFPALDGGKMILLVVEGIRKKPLSEKVEEKEEKN